MATAMSKHRAKLTATVRNPNEGDPPKDDTAEPISISVTGLPSGYHNSWGNLALRQPVNGSSFWASVDKMADPSASFAFAAVPGVYDIHLQFGSSRYFMPSRNITAGANNIPLSAFTPLEQISVTITDIPNRYIGSMEGSIRLMYPGTLSELDSNWVPSISGSSTRFSVFVIPGAYDVHLRFPDTDDGMLSRAYSAPSINIKAKDNAIPFAAFGIFEPISITVTGIPSQYIDGKVGAMFLNAPGLIDCFAENDAIRLEGSSATFTMFAMPGIYNVAFTFEVGVGDDDWGFSAYYVPRKNIRAGVNTIPFSFFISPPRMLITITGIPDRYIGDGDRKWASVRLAAPGTENWVASGWALSREFSLAISLKDRGIDWLFNTPGTYDVRLGFEVWENEKWAWTEAVYSVPSRSISTGNTAIPFAEFTPVEQVQNTAMLLEGR